ncbi:histidine kinase [Marinobacter salinisoli]|uniref:Histidine kinase n=1 Tax=Marinobacter salinisoli TaxID=2769486 RepID=A0ABX7MPZ6_9GAMM|nr:histidine kinase [Marinobacter salinisoli]QSP94219.1 histidine kinase [Marinobacter salinisoli]
MVLIVFLLAYVVRRQLDYQNKLSSDHFWKQWFHLGRKVEAGHEAGISGGLALVGLPALVAGLVMVALDALGLGFATYPLECLILVLLMGVPGWRPVLHAYSVAWRQGNMRQAWASIQDHLPVQERHAGMAPDDMHLTLSRAFLLTVFQRFFLIGFWYVVGGIGFAVLARGLVALKEQWPQAAARSRFASLCEVVAWAPVRVLSLTFGIAGDLAGWLSESPLGARLFSKPSDQLLLLSANASLTGYALDPERFSQIHPNDWSDFGERSLSAIRDLLNRSMLVWICGLALLVIFGVL